MRMINLILLAGLILPSSCAWKNKETSIESTYITSYSDKDNKPYEIHEVKKANLSNDITLEKDFTYTKHQLEDSYPYKDTTRQFQWDKIKQYLALIDDIQEESAQWGVIQNKQNKNGKAPLVKDHRTNDYNRPADKYGVGQYQAAPLYALTDTATAERYVQDGALIKIISEEGGLSKIKPAYIGDEWYVPQRYIHLIEGNPVFSKVIVVDRTNQNEATIEKVGDKWLIRSMVPATTGAHHPPYQQATPLGIFVVQQKKERMDYYKDGTTEIGGFAPYASRFSSGAYIHGVPLNAPHTQIVEMSSTLGTTPRSHMCVRNPTSHAEYVYHWAPVDESLVVVID